MKRPSLPAAIVIGLATLLGGVAAHDAFVPVPREISTRALAGGIETYRRFVSPLLRGRVTCRFEPTCSVYGLEVVRRYGALRGGWRAAARIARCTPATPMGTVDPP
ncbi:MAG TPA: membrane protein insertion efficiency factor YidD [Thermoanaerobaculia bacterium]|nr:membrane protein insertion efficiency factor YidD [Thermoanaerobaculia bacterium]